LIAVISQPMQNPLQLILRSGGQSGVDRAALDFAIANAIPYEGWCPGGGWAEDFPTPPGLLSKYPRLIETPSAEPDQRTLWNVRDSDSTLVMTLDGVARSPGTRFTMRCAEELNRPVCLLDLSRPESQADAERWLTRTIETAERRPFVLNIAGPRESQSPGIYAAALEALRVLLDPRL
jgi:hypothetical protein